MIRLIFDLHIFGLGLFMYVVAWKYNGIWLESGPLMSS